jgi:hypothetical protein
LQSGEFLYRIVPVDAMVIDFGVKEIPFEASIKMARNGPYTQLIKATSCVERSNAAMKAEELS